MQAAEGLRALAAELRRKGASVFATDHGSSGAGILPALAPDHPDTDAICLIQSFYALAVRVGGAARHRRRSAAPSAQGHANPMSKPVRHAVAADNIFDGIALHRNAAVLIDGDRIAGVMPRGELPADVAVRALPAGAWLAPGFIDLQVNGGGDVLFNDSPTPEAHPHHRRARTANSAPRRCFRP